MLEWAAMVIGMCSIELYLPGVSSLKAKRSILKRLVARLHKEFNVSCAEVDNHDVWQSAQIGLALVSNDGGHAQRSLESVVRWIERYQPDVQIVDYAIELIR